MPNQMTVKLESAPGALVVSSKWLGVEGDQEDVRNKYILSVDDGDVTVSYSWLRPIPTKARLGGLRPRLSVQGLALGFWAMLERALLIDDSLLEQLGGLDVGKSNIPAMIAELRNKYEL